MFAGRFLDRVRVRAMRDIFKLKNKIPATICSAADAGISTKCRRLLGINIPDDASNCTTTGRYAFVLRIISVSECYGQ